MKIGIVGAAPARAFLTSKLHQAHLDFMGINGGVIPSKIDLLILGEVPAAPDKIFSWLRSRQGIVAYLHGSVDWVGAGKNKLLDWKPFEIGKALNILRSSSAITGADDVLNKLEAASLKWERVDESPEFSVWKQNALGASMGLPSILLRKTKGEILASAPALEMCFMLADEAASLLKSTLNFEMSPDELKEELKRRLTSAPEHRSVFLQEFLTKGKVKLDTVVTPFLALAKKKELPCPLFKKFYALAKAYAG